ncbi:MAG: binding-protein-dependent transport system inner rane component [Ilumatobacteraceae bacterium]|nr:binding-protein-dependent transport system inner rane component [Ilumatobacteraceae bacterium]
MTSPAPLADLPLPLPGDDDRRRVAARRSKALQITGDQSGDGRRGRRIALRLLSLLAFFALWWGLTRAGIWDELFIPRPGAVWERFLESIRTKTTTTTTSAGMEIVIEKRGLRDALLWEHWWATVQRILWGLLWAVLVGVPLGLLLTTVNWFRVVFEPWIDFLRSLPPLAYFSLLIIWFGIGDTSKIWLLFLAGVAPITLSIVSGARSIPRDRLLAAQALGASRLQTIRHLVLPSVLPDFFNGFRLAVGFAWTTIVAAETTAGLPGIGGLAWVSKKTGQSDIVILCIIVIGVTAVLFDYGIKVLERRLLPWRGRG